MHPTVVNTDILLPVCSVCIINISLGNWLTIKVNFKQMNTHVHILGKCKSFDKFRDRCRLMATIIRNSILMNTNPSIPIQIAAEKLEIDRSTIL